MRCMTDADPLTLLGSGHVLPGPDTVMPQNKRYTMNERSYVRLPRLFPYLAPEDSNVIDNKGRQAGTDVGFLCAYHHSDDSISYVGVGISHPPCFFAIPVGFLAINIHYRITPAASIRTESVGRRDPRTSTSDSEGERTSLSTSNRITTPRPPHHTYLSRHPGTCAPRGDQAEVCINVFPGTGCTSLDSVRWDSEIAPRCIDVNNEQMNTILIGKSFFYSKTPSGYKFHRVIHLPTDFLASPKHRTAWWRNLPEIQKPRRLTSRGPVECVLRLDPSKEIEFSRGPVEVDSKDDREMPGLTWRFKFAPELFKDDDEVVLYDGLIFHIYARRSHQKAVRMFAPKDDDECFMMGLDSAPMPDGANRTAVRIGSKRMNSGLALAPDLLKKDDEVELAGEVSTFRGSKRMNSGLAFAPDLLKKDDEVELAGEVSTFRGSKRMNSGSGFSPDPLKKDDEVMLSGEVSTFRGSKRMNSGPAFAPDLLKNDDEVVLSAKFQLSGVTPGSKSGPAFAPDLLKEDDELPGEVSGVTPCVAVKSRP
ncbi:hypothetical protein C8R44DRAFT_856103 [Mycena epipterygia]|nr:hypothetical protein C8R44DRAFT_856103 [Mycena epipterygia]